MTKSTQNSKRKRLDIHWNTENMNEKNIESWIDYIIDIYCDAIIENFNPAIDKAHSQR